jgi:hypothetical protein
VDPMNIIADQSKAGSQRLNHKPVMTITNRAPWARKCKVKQGAGTIRGAGQNTPARRKSSQNASGAHRACPSGEFYFYRPENCLRWGLNLRLRSRTCSNPGYYKYGLSALKNRLAKKNSTPLTTLRACTWKTPPGRSGRGFKGFYL